MKGDNKERIVHRLIVGFIVILLCGSAFIYVQIPVTTGANDSDLNLTVSVGQTITIKGSWVNNTVTVYGKLIITGTLDATNISLKPGSEVEINGGTVILKDDDTDSANVTFNGTCSYFRIINGSLELIGADGSTVLNNSKGGNAIFNITATTEINIYNSSINVTGGHGGDYTHNSTTLGDSANEKFAGAGGNAEITFNTVGSGEVTISDSNITAFGGHGGNVQTDNGNSANGVSGSNADGTSGSRNGGTAGAGTAGGTGVNGGAIEGFVGSGGNADITISTSILYIEDSNLTSQGGNVGSVVAGNGGSAIGGVGGHANGYPSSTYGVNGGSGGTGGSGGSGGNGGDGGAITDCAGKGGNASITISATTVEIIDSNLTANGGSGTVESGDGGSANGGHGGAAVGARGYNGPAGAAVDGSNGGAGGNGGDAGAGGSGGHGGNVTKYAGAGGSAKITITATTIILKNSNITSEGGSGSAISDNGGSARGGSGGAANGGRGGNGGINTAQQEAGEGGDGGNGGTGGDGANGGTGGNGGSIKENAGIGGIANIIVSGSIVIIEQSWLSNIGGSGSVTSGIGSIDVSGGFGGPAYGGAAGSGIPDGSAGSSGTTGSSGSSGTSGTAGPVLGFTGYGGNANMEIYSIQPSIYVSTSFSTIAGSGRISGSALEIIPMSIPLLLAPIDEKITNTDLQPTFDWIDVQDSTTNGDLFEYRFELDNNDDFSSVEYTYSGPNTNYKPPTTLPDDKYYWRVSANYSIPLGNSAGWSDVWEITIDTTEVTFKNPIPTYWQNTTTPVCNITIEDIGGSGVSATTINYAISTDGGSTWGTLVSAGESINGQSILCSITPTFIEGTDNYIKWEARDLANNYKESEPYQIKIDITPPTTLSISINDGNPFTNTTLVTLSLGAVDTGSGVNQMAFSKDSTNWLSWEPFLSERSYNIPSNDGEKIIYYKVQDFANNTAYSSDTIILDTIPPFNQSILINNNDIYTNSLTVSLTLQANDLLSGVNTMAFSRNATNWTAWEPFNKTKSYNVTTGDGEKIVYFRVQDNAENMVMANDTIILDTTTPHSLSIVINDNELFTNSSEVQLSLSGKDALSGIYKIAFSNDNIYWTDWEEVTSHRSTRAKTLDITKQYDLPGDDGLKTVYFKVQDQAGNNAGPVSDTISLDTTPPEYKSIEINGNKTYTNSENVELTLNAIDTLSGISDMSFSTNSINWTAWEPFNSTKSFTLSSGDGEKVVYFKVRDKVNNTAMANDSIILDTTPPHSLSIIINDGALETNSTEVNLQLSAQDALSGLYQMAFSTDGTTWTDWETFSKLSSYSLTTNDGEKVVYFKVKDRAENIAEPVFASIILNTTVIVEDKDKDDDGILDAWELVHGLDPNNASDALADPDDDGLNNLEEFQANTEPKNADSDGDVMPDGWEVDGGLDPLTNDAKEDMDNDSYSNLEEFKGGSKPNDSSNIPSKKEKKKEDYTSVLIALLLVIIIIIILLVALARRKRRPEEEVEPEEDEEDWDKEEEEELEEEEEDWDKEEEEEPEEEIEDIDLGVEEELEPDVEPEPIEDIGLDIYDEAAIAAVPSKPKKGKLPTKGKAPKKGKLPEKELPPTKGKAPKKGKLPGKGKLPKKGKIPGKQKKAEFDEIEPPEESVLIPAEIESEFEPELVRLEGKSITCGICLGTIKTGLMSIKCKCGKYYHESCGTRVGECPKCDRKFKLEKLAKIEEVEMEELQDLEESEMTPEEFEQKKEEIEKTERERIAKLIRGLEDRLAAGEISETTYLKLREKYEK